MSGRNNRVVRNREKGNKVSWNWKIIGSVIAVVGIVVILTMLVGKAKAKKKVELAELSRNIPYEYFLLSTEKGIGVVDKTGKIILEANYTRN